VHALQGQPHSLSLSPLVPTQPTHPCSYSTVYFSTWVSSGRVNLISTPEIWTGALRAAQHLQATTAD
jgi:hypothetical protein